MFQNEQTAEQQYRMRPINCKAVVNQKKLVFSTVCTLTCGSDISVMNPSTEWYIIHQILHQVIQDLLTHL